MNFCRERHYASSVRIVCPSGREEAHARSHPDFEISRRRRRGGVSCLGPRAGPYQRTRRHADVRPLAFRPRRRSVLRHLRLHYLLCDAGIGRARQGAATLPAIFGTPGWYSRNHVHKSLAFISFTDGQKPVVFVGWSLEYEMYFYLALAAQLAQTKDAWCAVVVAFCGL